MYEPDVQKITCQRQILYRIAARLINALSLHAPHKLQRIFTRLLLDND